MASPFSFEVSFGSLEMWTLLTNGGEESRMRDSLVITDDPPPETEDPFVNDVWCLVYNMIEAGDTGIGDDGRQTWWAEEFAVVKRELRRRGFNLNPAAPSL